MRVVILLKLSNLILRIVAAITNFSVRLARLRNWLLCKATDIRK
jgi:hypothetical protein